MPIARWRSTAVLPARETTTATAPSIGTSQSQMHGGADVVDPGAGDARRGAVGTRVGGDAVDVVPLQPGVGDGGERGVDGQPERVPPQAAADVGGPDAGEDGGGLRLHGANTGTHAS